MFERRRTKGFSNIVRGSMMLVFLGILIMVIVVFRLYGRVFESNVSIDTDHTIFYIPTGSSYNEVLNSLVEEGILENKKSFNWVAHQKKYPRAVRPGRYKIVNNMNNNELLNLLRSGKQDPVMVVFNNVRTLEELAGRVSKYIETDSDSMSDYFNTDGIAEEYGFRNETFTCMFIPNTYEFYWTTTPESFTRRMQAEYENFWDGERERKAVKMEMTREEVITLASIVDEETTHDEENRRVAGLYINRMDRGIPLQADPTLKFALGDFSMKRIINEDKKIDSPYNTYKYRGLPPGPISIPSISAIDGVLNYEKHNYFYMCAKADFSGNHAFARNLSQHNKNARAYQEALNRNRIYR